MLKGMIYQSKNIVEILDTGIISDFEYRIISYGTHPCCYVGLPENHPYFGKEYTNIDIDCHGGLTYSDAKLHADPTAQESWWIGWDYAHCGDYAGYYELDCMKDFDHSKDKKWTTEELKEEVLNVIKELLEVEK